MTTHVNPLPFSFARQHRTLLLGGDTPELIHTSATPLEALLEVQRYLGGMPLLRCVDDTLFQDQLEALYGVGDSADANAIYDQLADHKALSELASALPAEDLLEMADDAPIVSFINAIFAEALRLNASDVHIESFENSLSVRLRIDGVLQNLISPDVRLAPLLVSRIKILAKLDIAEKRIPQDGRITVRIAGRPIDIRASVLPTGYGERVVLRILDTRNVRLDLGHLGMPARLRSDVSDLLLQPNGIILVTGPTGSGKTTTLYAGLQLLNETSRNILTVEDPIEYALEGIGQTQVNNRTGMTFSKGLRAILRQDPDVVLVGEIRDKETADIAVQASLTGHLVLSTLHTNDALGAITRLVDIGVEPFLIASALKGVLAQRLLRLLCPECKTKRELSVDEIAGIPFFNGEQLYEPSGCDACGHTGYSGRKGIFELLPITPDLQRAIHLGEGETVLRELTVESVGLYQQGLELLESGETSLAELHRTVRLG